MNRRRRSGTADALVADARQLRRRARRARSEEGYALILLTILLTVMVAMVGFSVDMGAWYRKGGRLQNAADASAMAGVVYMPGNLPAARTAARNLMHKNRYVHGVDNIATTVAPVPGHARRLRVCATDTRSPSLFASIFKVYPRINRCATAEYVLPVSLGSPLNVFDQSNLGVWPAVNGFCTALEEGDLTLSKYEQNKPPPGTVTDCPGATGQNSGYYDPKGYSYVVEMTADTTSAVAIDLYDATFHIDGASPIDRQTTAGATVDTVFEIRNLRATPLDETDDVLVQTRTVASNAALWKNTWRTTYTIPAGLKRQGHRYRIQVYTAANQANSAGSNAFGLRAGPVGVFARCSTIPGADYSASCTHVFAEDALSVYADAFVNPATFYLGSVDASFAGKTMVINLFDPGEGAQTIEILDPNGNPASFGWQTVDPHPYMAGTGTSLDVSGTVARLTNRNSASKFNERQIELQIALPDDYATMYGSNTWWKIRYTSGGTEVHDRTTWSVSITGEPVRLVPD